MSLIAVVICTRNPKQDYFNNALAALEKQTLSKQAWSLYIVDNGSDPPVAQHLDKRYISLVSEIIIEDSPGLTNARLAAIKRTKEDLIIFVDDDNLLDPNYLEEALEISANWSMLGTWGGQISGIFTEEPTALGKQYYNWLAIRKLEQDIWSNVHFDLTAHPCGAGMCVRRIVAEQYLRVATQDQRHLQLGRNGDRLWGSEDTDIAYTATSLGYGNGIFTKLHMRHIMPSNRFEEHYLLKLVEGMTCSYYILNFIWGKPVPQSSRSEKLLKWYQSFFISNLDRRFEAARQRGLAEARRLTTQGEFASSHAYQEHRDINVDNKTLSFQGE